MSQEMYLSGNTTIATGNSDVPLLETLFGATWRDTLQGLPNNLILRYDRDITFKLVTAANDAIDPQNDYNKPSTFYMNVIEQWVKGNPTFDIFVTNASGGTVNIDCVVFSDRLERSGIEEIIFDNINGDASEATLLLILAQLVLANATLTTMDGRLALIKANTDDIIILLDTQNILIGALNEVAAPTDTSSSGLNGLIKRLNVHATTQEGILTTIDADTGNIATSVASIDMKSTTIETNTGNTATSVSSIDTKSTTIATNTGTTATNTTSLVGYYKSDGSVVGADKFNPIAGQDGTNFQAILTDTSGRLIVSPNIQNPSTQNIAGAIISTNTTSGNDSATTVTVPAGGARFIWWDSNSSLQYQIRIGAGPEIIYLNAGATGSAPMNIAGTTTIALRPTSGNMVSGTDYVTIGVS